MGQSILLTMKSWQILPMIIGLVLLLGACGGGDDATPEPAPGDPTQAASAFMTALLNGDLAGCEGYSTQAVRESISTQCQAYAAAEASADLTNVLFVIIEREGEQAIVEMRGIYTISALDGGERVARQDDTPIRLLMRYENDFWRFDDFAN